MAEGDGAFLPLCDGVSSSASCSELIILGSGCSSGVPSPRCLIQPDDPPCKVCHAAMASPPETNRNYRCNTSLLIKFSHEDGKYRYIQIDVGKNFKEQVLRWFMPFGVPHLDAIILTHEHADAVLGLDDIRGVQPYNPYNLIEPTPVFLTQHSMESIAVKFPYLVEKTLKNGQEIRRVAQLDWRTIDNPHLESFEAAGLWFTPLPVMHGEDYISLGFLFGKTRRVAYISDVSRIPEDTEYAISKSGAGQVDLLILDALYKSLEALRRLQPKQALLVGMTHEFDHDMDNEYLQAWSKREGINVQLAYDGQKVPVAL